MGGGIRDIGNGLPLPQAGSVSLRLVTEARLAVSGVTINGSSLLDPARSHSVGSWNCDVGAQLRG